MVEKKKKTWAKFGRSVPKKCQNAFSFESAQTLGTILDLGFKIIGHYLEFGF